MKDKLRELVSELMSTCEMIGYATSGAERFCHREHRDKIKAELLALLDAEGDGGAVGAEQLAEKFHEAYERLAHKHGYRTREQSSVPWPDVPPQNKALMIDVCGELLEHFYYPARSGVVSDEELQAEAEAFAVRAGFTYGWEKLESWARRMAERAALEHFARRTP